MAQYFIPIRGRSTTMAGGGGGGGHHNQDNKSWQVDILSSDGRLVQRSFVVNAGSAHIDFQEKLKAGTYFLRATERQSQQHYISAFVVQ